MDIISLRSFAEKYEKLSPFQRQLILISAELKARRIDKPLSYGFTVIPYCWLFLMDNVHIALSGFAFLFLLGVLLKHYFL